MDSQAELKLFQDLGEIKATQKAIADRLDRWDNHCHDTTKHFDSGLEGLDSRIDKIEKNEVASTKRVTIIASAISASIASAAAAIVAFWKG